MQDAEMTIKQKIKIADKLYEQGSYYNAIDYYEEVLEEQAENSHVIHQLATLYYLSRDYKNAERSFKKLIEMSSWDGWCGCGCYVGISREPGLRQ